MDELKSILEYTEYLNKEGFKYLKDDRNDKIEYHIVNEDGKAIVTITIYK
jgi:hypothetical protein